MRKTKKLKTITWRMAKPKASAYSGIPLGTSVRKSFKKRVRELTKHFKDDGWDIDSNSAFEDALYDIFGTNLSTLFLAEVVGSGIAYWTIKSSGTCAGRGVFRKNKPMKTSRKKKRAKRK